MLNKIMLIGNLGRDPEMNYTTTGTAATKFSLAVSRHWNDRQSSERKEETTWFNCVAWNRLAETCNEYLRKGSRVYVEGRKTSRKYNDKDNVERTVWDVTLTDMQMLDRKGEGAGQDAAGDESDLSDIPF